MSGEKVCSVLNSERLLDGSSNTTKTSIIVRVKTNNTTCNILKLIKEIFNQSLDSYR